jgi:voltage-gated potassium channel
LLVVTIIKKVVVKIVKARVIALVCAMLSLIALGTIGGYLVEHSGNSGFQNLGDSLWWTLVTMSTVGYGDIVPKTAAGQVIAIICAVGGPILMVAGVTSVGSSLYNKWSRGVKGMGQVKSKGHIVICGWNRKAEDIISELHNCDLRDLPITIIDDKIESKPVADSDVSFIRGNASEISVLNRANIAEAKFAIVLAHDDTAIADQKTVLTVLAIKAANHAIVSCAELNDVNNDEHLKRAGCDIVINVSSLASRMMAMSLKNPAVNDIVKSLVSQEGSEIYRIAVPKQYLGRSFIDILSEMKKAHDIIPVGVERDGEYLFNPAASLQLKDTDLLLVLSEETPVIK